MGHGDPSVDDQKVTFPRGGGRKPTMQPLHPLLPLNEMEGGNPEDNLFDPLPLLNLMKMWYVL